MAAGRPKITFDRISRHFKSIRNFLFFIFCHKMAAGGHFGRPKITFDRISRHFKSIRNLYFFLFCFTKWLPAAILENRKSLSIAFLVISNQYAICIFFILFHKMAAGGHFGKPKITFDRISRNFKSIRNLYFASQNGCRRPFWKTEYHIRSHFSSCHINTQFIIFFTKWLPAAILMTEDHFRSHFSPFQINIQLYFLEFVFKMAAGGHFGSPIFAKNIRVLPLCVINGYAKYEVDR